MKEVARKVHQELHDAFRSVESAWKVVQLTRQQLSAGDDVLEARRTMYEVNELRQEDNLRALSAWGLLRVPIVSLSLVTTRLWLAGNMQEALS